MKENSFCYYKNTSCGYFPCHKVENDENFNCMFCYYPLYALGDKCGGNFRYIEMAATIGAMFLYAWYRMKKGHVDVKAMEDEKAEIIAEAISYEG